MDSSTFFCLTWELKAVTAESTGSTKNTTTNMDKIAPKAVKVMTLLNAFMSFQFIRINRKRKSKRIIFGFVQVSQRKINVPEIFGFMDIGPKYQDTFAGFGNPLYFHNSAQAF